jgi:hypothetical protein
MLVKQPPSEVARIVHTECAPAFVVEMFSELVKHCRCHCFCSVARGAGLQVLFTYTHKSVSSSVVANFIPFMK